MKPKRTKTNIRQGKITTPEPVSSAEGHELNEEITPAEEALLWHTPNPPKLKKNPPAKPSAKK